ncbi:hypothetical protein GCM10011502_30200 [Oceanisphaera marina]|uniref:Uncharacterized protein n=1 Tax=Oceanisphaera marina TaxID=2017550 RepID=A0ABQ1J0V2_9GAMM|nr:hypothetical protein [Oceanisphaera marina]GGB55206.1 hypothetical protein GCM10011502_30200 [Oceanisphaera marina]
MSGVKIPYSYDSKGNEVTILDYFSLGKPHPIFCGGNDCKAELVYVSASQRVGKNKITQVPAYFRLAKYENHSISCSFETCGKKVIDAAGSSNEVAVALANGMRVFRIHLMDEKDQSDMEKKESNFLNNHTHDTVKRTYRKRGCNLPYVNSLSGLLELYNYGRENSAVRSSIFVMIDKKKTQWEDFFFDVKHYDILHKKVLVNGPVKAAIVGNVKRVSFSTPQRKFSSAEFSPKINKYGQSIYPVARLKKGLSHNFINPGAKVLCFGSFKLESDSFKRISSTA